MKKLLIVNGSPRKNGCDAVVAAKAAEISAKYGYESETLFLDDMNIHGCRACMACKKTGRCVQNDGVNEIVDRVRSADMLLLATPVYFSGESAQMKTFIDRLYSVITEKNGIKKIDMGNVKKASILVTCGAPNGNMTFAGIVARYIGIMKMLGITDAAGTVIPGATPENILDSAFAEEYLNGFEFQLEM